MELRWEKQPLQAHFYETGGGTGEIVMADMKESYNHLPMFHASVACVSERQIF